ncbi:type IV pilus modification protein PilV [Ramlibacter sp.]|uniref:type IV pilus modification protein PilV n=1 Tax=Ramlibacter sp. TaxID=1917967 RepID=UPI0017908EDF|nr:type IV pilus modification protein PilV [Ramlibacter sp.]MBA2674664.1 type IV pilus modification protein PilV [Ramlibacter sp.]
MHAHHARTAAPRKAQGGFTLIEVLVSVLLFSIGILGAVGMQARAIRMSTDAQQRAEAAFLADQLLARLLISNKSTSSTFNHYATVGATCAPGGSASTNAVVTEWLADVTATLPRAQADEQQVIVSGGSTPPDEVTIRLCWKNGESDTPHVLEVSNRVQWP